MEPARPFRRPDPRPKPRSRPKPSFPRPEPGTPHAGDQTPQRRPRSDRRARSSRVSRPSPEGVGSGPAGGLVRPGHDLAGGRGLRDDRSTATGQMDQLLLSCRHLPGEVRRRSFMPVHPGAARVCGQFTGQSRVVHRREPTCPPARRALHRLCTGPVEIVSVGVGVMSHVRGAGRRVRSGRGRHVRDCGVTRAGLRCQKGGGPSAPGVFGGALISVSVIVPSATRW